MIPIEFKQQNGNLGANPAQPEVNGLPVQSLPVYSNGEQCISLWQLSWKERFEVLFYGRLWLSVASGFTQPPVFIYSGKSVFMEETEEEQENGD